MPVLSSRVMPRAGVSVSVHSVWVFDGECLSHQIDSVICGGRVMNAANCRYRVSWVVSALGLVLVSVCLCIIAYDPQ